MSRVLVAYFSASGITAQVAEKLSKALGGDLHEITPAVTYTKADLDWMDENSRSSVEMKDKSFRPAVANQVENMEEYDVIFIGFPIWWYTAPTIINTFLEKYDLSGKTIVPFATSGSSQMGQTNDDLKGSCEGAVLVEGKRFPSGIGEAELKKWAQMTVDI